MDGVMRWTCGWLMCDARLLRVIEVNERSGKRIHLAAGSRLYALICHDQAVGSSMQQLDRHDQAIIPNGIAASEALQVIRSCM